MEGLTGMFLLAYEKNTRVINKRLDTEIDTTEKCVMSPIRFHHSRVFHAGISHGCTQLLTFTASQRLRLMGSQLVHFSEL
jgi:hypothetical protein